MRPLSGGRRALARVALVAAGLLGGVLLAEAVARAVAPAGNADLLFGAPAAVPPGLYVNDPDLLMVPAPGFEGTAASLGYHVPLRIDALGLRGPEVPAKGATPRWLLVGDSFALSLQTREEETFAARLAALAGVEVWNGGVDGYSTWQALGRYRRLADPLAPDAVLLLFFTGNDLSDNVAFDMRRQTAGGRAAGTPIPVPGGDPLTRWLSRWSHLYAHARVWSNARALAGGRDPMAKQWRDELALFSQEGAGELQRTMPRTREALQALRDEVRARGDRLLVAVAPPAFAVDTDRVAPTFAMVGLDPARADLDAPGRAVLGAVRELGVAGCDLAAPLRAEAAKGARLYLTYDGHWTPEGHRVVAEALAACVAGAR